MPSLSLPVPAVDSRVPAEPGLTAFRRLPDKPLVRPTASVTAGSRRRTGRGHIDSYGEDRVCGRFGCTTRLSRYNAEALCALHNRPDELHWQ